MPKLKNAAVATNGKTQLDKALQRVNKITVFRMLAKRLETWAGAESDPARKAHLANLRTTSEYIEKARVALATGFETLVDVKYVPPKKSTSGELKFEYGRQVWLKPKYKATYIEGGWTDDQLANLYVNKIVKGRVFVTMGLPDPNTPSPFPPLSVPKIHLTGTAPTE